MFAINAVLSLRLLFCAIFALILTNPETNLGLTYASLGMLTLPLAGMAVWAAAAPIVIGASWLLCRFGVTEHWPIVGLTRSALCGLVLHLGYAAGMPRWGDAGGGIGGKNIPYAEALLYPVTMFKVMFGLT
ncbi:MAG: hypothetical protein QM773_08160 [Hyphomonadaceae bacterium]